MALMQNQGPNDESKKTKQFHPMYNSQTSLPVMSVPFREARPVCESLESESLSNQTQERTPPLSRPMHTHLSQSHVHYNSPHLNSKIDILSLEEGKGEESVWTSPR